MQNLIFPSVSDSEDIQILDRIGRYAIIKIPIEHMKSSKKQKKIRDFSGILRGKKLFPEGSLAYQKKMRKEWE